MMWVARSGELKHDFWDPNNQLKNREMRDYTTSRDWFCSHSSSGRALGEPPNCLPEEQDQVGERSLSCPSEACESDRRRGKSARYVHMDRKHRPSVWGAVWRKGKTPKQEERDKNNSNPLKISQRTWMRPWQNYENSVRKQPPSALCWRWQLLFC